MKGMESMINNRRVIRYDSLGNKKEYDSVKEAAEDNDIFSNQIARAVREGKTVKGYTYEYVDEKEPIRKKSQKELAAIACFRRKPFYLS